MTRRASAMAEALAGRWRIAEMDVWDNDDLDLAGPARAIAATAKRPDLRPLFAQPLGQGRVKLGDRLG